MSFERQTLNHYESEKRRDWNNFCQYLNDKYVPPISLTSCTGIHVVEYLRSLDQFGTTKVHFKDCVFYGKDEPPTPCDCPLMQAWESLDAPVHRLKTAYEENVGSNGMNPFSSGVTKAFLHEVKEYQSAARGVSFVDKFEGEWITTDSYYELVFKY